MPELPEVQTTVAGLAKVLPGLTITDVWSDVSSRHPMHRESIKNASYFKTFQSSVSRKKILGVRRRAKNILIDLDHDLTILIHMKMTGHLLYGKFSKMAKGWKPAEPGPLNDPFNRFIHVVFSLSNGASLALSDMRKFAKIALISTNEVLTSAHLAHIGPEPLERNFTFEKFNKRLLKKPEQKIKAVLLDQSVIAGIGNIYSDEMLWHAGIHPFERIKKIPVPKMKKLYEAMKLVLKKGIDFSGDSTSDYRTIEGLPGKFHLHHEAYRKTGTKCGKRDGGVILRAKLGGRSAHYCSAHQALQK